MKKQALEVTLYKKVYRILNHSTPLSFDCGNLCNKKCCDIDSKKGMLLFPGEEYLFKNITDFTLKPTNIFIDSNIRIMQVSCNGQCNRNQRPLSCRIFPFFPYLNKNDSITIVPDFRAIDICPLLKYDYKINKKFIKKVQLSFKLLSKDNNIKNFLKIMAKEFDEFLKFY